MTEKSSGSGSNLEPRFPAMPVTMTTGFSLDISLRIRRRSLRSRRLRRIRARRRSLLRRILRRRTWRSHVRTHMRRERAWASGRRCRAKVGLVGNRLERVGVFVHHLLHALALELVVDFVFHLVERQSFFAHNFINVVPTVVADDL